VFLEVTETVFHIVPVSVVSSFKLPLAPVSGEFGPVDMCSNRFEFPHTKIFLSK
jgi:hypothetical protein